MSKVKEFLKNVDKGFYHEARKGGLTPGQFLARQIEPTEEEVDKTFARLLKQYKVDDDGGFRALTIRDFAEEKAALNAVLRERKIRRSDSVEKAFFASENDSALFPVFLATQIIAGQLAGSLVPRLAATEERIDSGIAEKITMNETEGDRQLKFTGEGATLPKTKLSRAEGQVQVFKYGRVLEWTYETARRMKLDIISLFLQRMGIQMGIDETDDLIEVLIAGDGTSGSAVADTDAEVSGTLDYDELIRIFQAFPKGYRMTDAVINDTNIRTILNLPEFKDPLIQLRFQENGIDDSFPILGATAHRWTSTNATSFSTDRILAVDRRFAIKVLVEGDMMDESDRIIDKQINQRAMSYNKGYMKLDNNSTQCLDINT